MSKHRRDLSGLLRPRSIAVVGASEDPSRIGGMPLSFLKEVGYAGQVFAVNPRRKTVQGQQAFPSVRDVPGPVDLAIIAVPAGAVLQVAQDCAEAGAGGAVIFSSGFAEAGQAGRAAQDGLAEIARSSRMRILGPNCAGIMNVHQRMTATFGSHLMADTTLIPGAISIISQSGAVGAYMFALARAKHVGLSYWITTGNEADTDVTDYVSEIAQDPNTRVIALVVENLPDVKRLAQAARAAQRARIPIVALMIGRSPEAAIAVQSHSAAIATDYAIASAVLRACGIHEVQTIDELLSSSEALATEARPAGPRTGLISMSGGIGVLMLDRALDCDLQVPTLPPEMQREMRSLLPYAATANPVDITGNLSNTPHVFAEYLQRMSAGTHLDSIVCFLGHVLPAPVGKVFVEDIARIQRDSGKPIWVVGCDDPSGSVSRALAEAGIPFFQDPSRAIDALGQVVRLTTDSQSAQTGPATRAEVRPACHEGRQRRTVALSEIQSQRALSTVGIRFADQRVVHSPTEAETDARELAATGGALVMKVVADGLVHKADVRGVKIGVDLRDVASEYSDLVSNVAQTAPEATVTGAVLQRMYSGEAVLVGARIDDRAGPVVVFGAGGAHAELRNDAAVALAPVSLRQAQTLINQTRIGQLLHRLPAIAAEGLDELAQLIVKVSEFIASNVGAISSVELNPVLLSRSTAVAVDASVISWD